MEDNHKYEVLFITLIVLVIVGVLLWQGSMPPQVLKKPAVASDNLAMPSRGMIARVGGYMTPFSPLPIAMNTLPVVAMSPATDPRLIGIIT